MGDKRTTMIHIASSIWLCGSYSFLSKGESTVLLLVHNSSLVCIGVFIYYLVYLFVKVLFPRKFACCTEDIEKGRYLPAVSVSNVVYGLGSIFYICAYTFTMKNMISTFFFCIGLSVLCFCINDDSIMERGVVLLLCILSVFFGVGIGNFTLYLDQIIDGSYTVLLWETLIPFLTVGVLWGLKRSHESIVQIFEFGIPIMFVFGVIFLLIEESFLLECGDYGRRLKTVDLYSIFLCPIFFTPLIFYMLYLFFNDGLQELLVGMGIVIYLVRLGKNELDWAFAVGGVCMLLATVIRISKTD
jgi:hypothetical protein